MANGDRIIIDRLLVRGVVGLNEWERRAKQDILVSLSLETDLHSVGLSDRLEGAVNYSHVARQIMAHVESSQRFTIEALATDIAGICLAHPQVSRAKVKVTKPAADRFARAISVRIERTAAELMQDAYIAIGSNSDDAPAKIVQAAEHLRGIGGLAGASGVYQTRPINGSSGRDYLNAAVRVRTCLPGAEIRRRLKVIEERMGRAQGQECVPIDLDLCLLGAQQIEAADITLPRPEVFKVAYLARVLAEAGAVRVPGAGEKALADLARELGSEQEAKPRPDVVLPRPNALGA
ncbi:MAG: 2-amino-4-hydroxy-6-hydroxymethyldihydropteridine diphosphokinase [Phycisphaeraceae bacterium]|nr:2-amino-4-hydroxy-6-hydroxymethyldihydropteridine diphosphokinase [Phycisphaeraceae bacterium]